MAAREPKMSYLDNGVIRLGIDLGVGGSITYLSRSGTDENLVNSWDFGRQIQMSYYSGPVPFRIDGKEPKKEWDFIGWNPIQVGDAFGNASTVLEQTQDGKSLYVKCIPMHWPLNNVPGECTFESWLELEGPVVHARCRMVNHRPDHTQYPARHQELPAIYTNGPWYRLMSYAGDHPFTNGPLSRIEKPKGQKFPWASWTATESWAAMVDDHDFGLGIWIAGVCDFKGGFAGKPGSGGPHDGPTGYIAPQSREIIDWNITHEYRYDLIVGPLTDIRKHVYAHARRPVPPVYVFESDRQGWSYEHASDTGWPIKGELNVAIEQDDPQLIGPVGFWNATDAPTMVIEAAIQSASSDARIYWRGIDDKSFTDAQSMGFVITPDGEVRSYRVKLSTHAKWRNGISQLRFDPVGHGRAGEWMHLKSIRFEP